MEDRNGGRMSRLMEDSGHLGMMVDIVLWHHSKSGRPFVTNYLDRMLRDTLGVMKSEAEHGRIDPKIFDFYHTLVYLATAHIYHPEYLM